MITVEKRVQRIRDKVIEKARENARSRQPQITTPKYHLSTDTAPSPARECVDGIAIETELFSRVSYENARFELAEVVDIWTNPRVFTRFLATMGPGFSSYDIMQPGETGNTSGLHSEQIQRQYDGKYE